MTPRYLFARLHSWLVSYIPHRTPEGIEAEIEGLCLIIVWDSDSGELSLIDLLDPGKPEVIIRSESRLEFILCCLAIAQARPKSIRRDETPLEQ